MQDHISKIQHVPMQCISEEQYIWNDIPSSPNTNDSAIQKIILDTLSSTPIVKYAYIEQFVMDYTNNIALIESKHRNDGKIYKKIQTYILNQIPVAIILLPYKSSDTINKIVGTPEKYEKYVVLTKITNQSQMQSAILIKIYNFFVKFIKNNVIHDIIKFEYILCSVKNKLIQSQHDDFFHILFKDLCHQLFSASINHHILSIRSELNDRQIAKIHTNNTIV